jgi:cytochrome c oxidase assembly protein subunit 15
VSRWVFVALLQAVLGYTQYLTGVPEILVGLHVAGATAVSAAAAALVLDASAPRPQELGGSGGIVETGVTTGIESSPNVTPTS